jgi:hypothetical protein
MGHNSARFIEDCRKARDALIDTVAELKAANVIANPRDMRSTNFNVSISARILNCESSIALYDSIIKEAEAKYPKAAGDHLGV